MEKPKILTKKSQVPKSAKIVEAYRNALTELFFIRNPHLKKVMPHAQEPLKQFLKEYIGGEIWVYYPWRNVAVHTVPEKTYFELRTARNRNIINEKEQKSYRNMRVGIAGLSVGSSILHALVMSGGPKRLKIADFDVLEITNLNRIRGGLPDVSSNKTHIAARQVWELDPFAQLELWGNGIAHETLDKFLTKPKLDVFIDEMDSLDLKIMARWICKKNRIPVLMATDNGDGVLLDVERFDLEPRRPIFHGLVDLKPKDLKNLDFKTWLRLATQIVGPEYLTDRMQESLLLMGKKVSAVPQLGPSAAVGGSAMGFAVRQIANGADLPSGRYVINLEEKLIPKYFSPQAVRQRKTNVKKFLAAFMHPPKRQK